MIEIKRGIDIHFEIKNTMDYDKSQKLQQIRYVIVDDLIKKMVSDGKGNMLMDEAVFSELTKNMNEVKKQ